MQAGRSGRRAGGASREHKYSAAQLLAIQESQNVSDIATSQQDLDFARQDLVKYREGESVQQLQSLDEEISLAHGGTDDLDHGGNARDDRVWLESRWRGGQRRRRSWRQRRRRWRERWRFGGAVHPQGDILNPERLFLRAAVEV